MPNPAKSFLSSFEKSYQTGSERYLQEERAKDTLEREIALQNYKNQIEQEEERKQSEIMEPLLSGKVFQIAAGRFPGQRDITPQERTARLLKLSPKGLTRYKSLREITGDTEGYDKISELLGLNDPNVTKNLSPETINRVNRTISASKLMGVKPEKAYEELDKIINPKISKTIEQPHSSVHIYSDGRQEVVPYEGEGLNPAYKPIWRESEIPGSLHKDKSGRYVQEVGLYDPNADMWEKDKKGKFHVSRTKQMKITSTDTNGEKIFSKELNEHFKKYKTDINNISKALNSNINPETGSEFTEEEKKQYLTKLGTISSNFSEEVKNTAPPSFTNWYKQIYNYSGGNKKAKTNPDKATYWNELMKAYRRGDLSAKALQAGYNLYLSTYLSNPLLEYGINQEDYTIEGEEEQTNEDDE